MKIIMECNLPAAMLVYGLFLSARMLGRAVWVGFAQYKKYLPPVLRRQLEELWTLSNRLGWI